MSKEMLSKEEFIKELTEKQEALGTFFNVLHSDLRKTNLLDGTSIDSLVSSIADLLFGSIQQNNLEQIHRFLNGEVGGSLLSLIQQVSMPLSESLEGLKNKKLSFLVSHKVSVNQSLIELLSLSLEKDIQVVTKSGRTGKIHNPATLFPKNLKTALKLYPPIENVQAQSVNNTLVAEEINETQTEKNGESIGDVDTQASSREEIISQEIELFLKNSNTLTEFCKIEYESEYQPKEGHTLSLFDVPSEEDYISMMKKDIQNDVMELIFVPIKDLYNDIENIKKAMKRLYELTKRGDSQSQGNAINIMSLLKFTVSFDVTAYKDSELNFIDIFKQSDIVSDNNSVLSLRQLLTIEKINMLRGIVKKNLQEILNKHIYAGMVQSLEIKEVVLPTIPREKIKINFSVNNLDTARKFDNYFSRYLVYVFAKYLHISVQDILKIIEINYKPGNMPAGNKTLFDDYIDNSEYLNIIPVQAHNGNKDAIKLMGERADSILGFGDMKHAALVGNESTGRTALAKRSISKVLEYLPYLRVKEITGDSFKKDWSTLWKDHYKNNKNTDTINKFNAVYNVDVLIIRDIESLGSATEKAQTKMSELLQQPHMKCILISKNPIGYFIGNFSSDLKKAILGLGIQSQKLSQPNDRARKKILNALFRAEKIIIDDELVDIASVCVSSTESYPMLVKTIKRHAKDNKVILNKGEFMQLLRDTIGVVNLSYTLLELDGLLNEYIEEIPLYSTRTGTAKIKMKNKLITYIARCVPKGGSDGQSTYFTISELSSYLHIKEASINNYISDIRTTYYNETLNVKNYIIQKLDSRLHTRLYNNDLFDDAENLT